MLSQKSKKTETPKMLYKKIVLLILGYNLAQHDMFPIFCFNHSTLIWRPWNRKWAVAILQPINSCYTNNSPKFSKDLGFSTHGRCEILSTSSYNCSLHTISNQQIHCKKPFGAYRRSDWWRCCKVLCGVNFSQIAGNGKKCRHKELSKSVIS